MNVQHPPIISVRRVGNVIEYYIQQGNKRLNFFLDQQTFETLMAAERGVGQAFGKSEAPHPPLLRVIGSAS